MAVTRRRPPIADPQRRALTPAEAGERLGLSSKELARLRGLGEGPAFVTLTQKSVRYLRSSVDDWEAQLTAWNERLSA